MNLCPDYYGRLVFGLKPNTWRCGERRSRQIAQMGADLGTENGGRGLRDVKRTNKLFMVTRQQIKAFVKQVAARFNAKLVVTL